MPTPSPASFDITTTKTGRVTIVCSGYWTLPFISMVSVELRDLTFPPSTNLTIDTQSVSSFDMSAAWLLATLRDQIDDSGTFKHRDSNPSRCNLVDVVIRMSLRRSASLDDSPPDPPLSFPQDLWLRACRVFSGISDDIALTLHILGESLSGIFSKVVRGRVSLTSVIHQFDLIGFRAVPVIVVMSFLIGGIIAQQSAFLLKDYGEELLSINLVSVLLLREIGVLLTAIMIAGRSGSAITAELGTMKMREEMDALSVMGFNPVSVLVLPRMLALILAVPLLTLIADLSGLLGALSVSYFYVGIPPIQFVVTLSAAIDLSTVLSGLLKAPFMALAILLIAVVEGLKVDGSSESIGHRTTASVVRSIFVVIIIDCLFALFYAAVDY